MGIFFQKRFNSLLAAREAEHLFTSMWMPFPSSFQGRRSGGCGLARAAMSRLHPGHISDRYVAGEFEGAIEVLQEPGDILYVPAGWGHAVLNVAEYTVSISVEFGPP